MFTKQTDGMSACGWVFSTEKSGTLPTWAQEPSKPRAPSQVHCRRGCLKHWGIARKIFWGPGYKAEATMSMLCAEAMI